MAKLSTLNVTGLDLPLGSLKTFPYSAVGASSSPSDVILENGTWLKSGKIYSKTDYPEYSQYLGDVNAASFTPSFISTSGSLISTLHDDQNIFIGGSSVNNSWGYSNDGGISFIEGYTSSSSTAMPDFNGLYYGNNLYVAYGDAGVISTSTDGIEVQDQNSPTTQNLWGGTYGDGKYIVVGNSKTFVTSTDGQNWISEGDIISNAATRTYYTIDYSNNLFTLGKYGIDTTTNDSYLFTSTDGISWNSITASSYPANSYFHLSQIVYGGGKWVGAGRDGFLITSTDGQTWLRNRDTIASDVLDVYYDPIGGWMVGSDNGVEIQTDGFHWQRKFQTAGCGVTYHNGTHYAYTSSATVISSTDGGDTWVTGTSNVLLGRGEGLSFFRHDPYKNKILLARYGELVWSDDGFITSEKSSVQYSNDITDVCITPDQTTKYAVTFSGQNGSTSSGSLWTSTNGTTWTNRSSAGWFGGVAYGNGIWIAGGNDRLLLTSTDGVTWNSSKIKPGKYNSLVLSHTRNYPIDDLVIFDSITEANDARMSLFDRQAVWIEGTGWRYYDLANHSFTTITSTGSWIIMSVIFANGQFVITTSTGEIITTVDGINFNYYGEPGMFWSGTPVCHGYHADVGYYFSSGGNGFSQGHELISTHDFINWEIKIDDGGAYNLKYLNNKFVMTAPGQIFSSTDGYKWETNTSLSDKYTYATNTYPVFDVDYVNGYYLTVGDDYATGISTSLSDFKILRSGGRAVDNISTVGRNTYTLRACIKSPDNNSLIFVGDDGFFGKVSDFNDDGPESFYLRENSYVDGRVWNSKKINGKYFLLGPNLIYYGTNMKKWNWLSQPREVGTVISGDYGNNLYLFGNQVGQVFTSTDLNKISILSPLSSINNVEVKVGHDGTYFYLPLSGTKYYTDNMSDPKHTQGMQDISVVGPDRVISADNGSSVEQIDLGIFDSNGEFVNRQVFGRTGGEYSYRINNTNNAYQHPAGLAYNGSYYLLATTGQGAYSSVDGTLWTYTGPITGITVDSSLYWFNNQWVVGTQTGIEYSTDGVSWTQVPNSSIGINSGYLKGIKVIGNTVYAWSSQGVIASSTDLSTWTDRSGNLTTSYNIQGIAYNSSTGVYMIIMQYSSKYRIYKTTDFTNFTETFVHYTTLYDIEFLNGIFMAVGNTSSVIYTNDDGLNWTDASPVGTDILEIFYLQSTGKFYLFADNGRIYTTTDGLNLRKDEPTPGLGYYSQVGNSITDAEYNGDDNIFITVALSGVVKYSTDLGVTWNSVDIGTTENLRSVSYSSGTYYIVGDNNTLKYSSDLIVWKDSLTGNSSNSDLLSVSSSPYGRVAIAGENGVAFTSKDVSQVEYSPNYNLDTEFLLPEVNISSSNNESPYKQVLALTQKNQMHMFEWSDESGIVSKIDSWDVYPTDGTTTPTVAFSPDGRWVLGANTGGQVPQLIRFDPDQGFDTSTILSAPTNNTSGYVLGQDVWTPNNQFIFFAYNTTDSVIMCEWDTNTGFTGNNYTFTSSVIDYIYYMDVSPDGKYLALATSACIMVLSIDYVNKSLSTVPGTYYISSTNLRWCKWDPSGSGRLYSSSSNSPYFRMYTFNPATGLSAQSSSQTYSFPVHGPGCDVWDPVFSPSKGTSSRTSYNSTNQIETIRPIVYTPSNNNEIRAYSSYEGGRIDLSTYAITGTNSRIDARWTATGTANWVISRFSPSGKSLVVYKTNSNTPLHLVAWNVDPLSTTMISENKIFETVPSEYVNYTTDFWALQFKLYENKNNSSIRSQSSEEVFIKVQ